MVDIRAAAVEGAAGKLGGDAAGRAAHKATHSKPAQQLGAVLTRRYGSFSGAQWLGIGAAGVGLGLAAKRAFGAGGETAAVEAGDGTAAVEGDTPPGTQGAVLLLGANPPPQGQTEPANNQEWARRAIDLLVKRGKDALLAQGAITKFLAGQPLTQAEAALVKLAIRDLGTPPDGAEPVTLVAPATAPKPANRPTTTVPGNSGKPAAGGTTGKPRISPVPPQSTKKPTTKPGPSPTSSRVHLVASGDTLSAIARRYYGASAMWPRIYQANRDVIDSTAKQHGKPGGGHWIWPGTTLRIP